MAANPLEAVSAYQQAVELDPELMGAYIGLGHVLKTVGDHDGGVKAYRRAIELRPNFGETYYSLANLKTFRFSHDDIREMQHRLKNEQLPVDCKVHFAFALGKAFEDQKDFDRSFEYYALANEKHRDTIAYDPVQTEVAHERMRPGVYPRLLQASLPQRMRVTSAPRSDFHRWITSFGINVA